MYSVIANQNYKEERKREKESLKKARDLEKSIERSKSSSLKQADIQKQKRSYATKPSKGKTITDSDRQHFIKRLDIRFSIFIRLLYAEPVTGLCKCTTCATKLHWKEMQLGHFIERANYKYRREEKNCHPQCQDCNEYKNGNLKEYRSALVHKYGELVVNDMLDDRYNPMYDKIPTHKIQEYADKYQSLSMNLLMEKRLQL